MKQLKNEIHPVLRTQAVTLLRGEETQILQNIDWEVLRDENWVILGPNGSGKTSLLKLICGYEWPTEGRIEVLGAPFGETELQETRKSLGWVSSALETRIHGSDSALEVVLSGIEASIGLWRKFTSPETQRARRILDSLGAGSYTDRRYEFLSQGERQRVLIARSMINRPKLLILDEPCAGLDPVSREAFLGDLTRFAGSPRPPTIILVTHHVEEIPDFISHALILREGRVAASGSLAEVCTSKVLSLAYGHPLKVTRRAGRFSLSLK